MSSSTDPPRLLLDAMLGKLARYLRMCGYDAAYALDRGVEDDDALAALADAEDRRLLTRDEALARRVDGVRLRSREITDQLRELREASFELSLPERPRRCSACNGRVDPLPPDASTPEYAPDPGDRPLFRCRDCGQVYWTGSHWADVGERLADL